MAKKCDNYFSVSPFFPYPQIWVFLWNADDANLANVRGLRRRLGVSGGFTAFRADGKRSL
jgi:hypothetical protein